MVHKILHLRNTENEKVWICEATNIDSFRHFLSRVQERDYLVQFLNMACIPVYQILHFPYCRQLCACISNTRLNLIFRISIKELKSLTRI